MKVRVKMKDGRTYAGIKGGIEGGLLYLFLPKILEKGPDDGEDDEPTWERNVVNTTKKGGHVMLPINDIEIIISQGE